MLSQGQILDANKANYQDLYSKQQAFLRYPADWVIRFHNMYLKDAIPTGRVLDFGMGGGNNSIFFIEKGYETYGIDVTDAALHLLKLNLQGRNLDGGLASRFSVISPDEVSLPYESGFFDFILSNQVLYYLPSEQHIRAVCKELSRCLRPGGVVFFTMMGPKNYYITHYAVQIRHKNVYEIAIEDTLHRLYGVREFIYLVRDENELKRLFSEFECVTTGYFDQGMFDMTSNFHWIFAGRKPDGQM